MIHLPFTTFGAGCLLFLWTSGFSAHSGAGLVNGDFEADDEGGWSYLGRADGSHGVFSEPSRPGTHVYLLQLNGSSDNGFSAISQVLDLEKGEVYRLRVDLWNDSLEPPPGASAFQSATLDEASLFDRDLCGPGRASGWTTLSALFRAPREHPVLQVRLAGSGLDRESSTTLVDRVRIEKVEQTLPLPLLPGKPLAPARSRVRLPFALGYPLPSTGYVALQACRDRFGDTPALVSVAHSWSHPPSVPIWPGLSAWVRSGVVPIVSIPWFPEDCARLADAGMRERLRTWAEEARRWRYPLLLRLGPEMDLYHERHEADAFRTAWRDVHELFEKANARNVHWFWSPDRLGGAAHRYFPGNEFVDVVGFTLRSNDPLEELNRGYRIAQRRYPKAAIAVAGSRNAPPPPATVIRSFPRLAFFTVGNRHVHLPEQTTPLAQSIRRALEHPSASPQLRQIQPPRLRTRIYRNGDLVTLVVINRSSRSAASAATLRVEFWQGHPFVGGIPLQTFRNVTIRPGHRQTIRTHAPPPEEGQAHVLIDLAADPRFLAAHPDELDWKADPDLLVLPVPD